MRLRIEGDGTPHGTRVVDADTGEELEFVQSVQYSHEAGSCPTLTVTVMDPTINAEAEGDVGRIGGVDVDISPVIVRDLTARDLRNAYGGGALPFVEGASGLSTPVLRGAAINYSLTTDAITIAHSSELSIQGPPPPPPRRKLDLDPD